MTQQVESWIRSRDEAVDYILLIGQRALAARDLDRAREVFADVLLIDPDNDLAKRALAAVESTMPVPPSHEVRLTRPPAAFLGESMPPDEAFVLSRLAAGPMRMFKLLEFAAASGREAEDVVAALDRLRAAGAVCALP